MSVTLASLETQTRQRADMVFSKFVADDELKGYINASWKELYDLLTSRFENYYSSTVNYTVLDNLGFDLPEDFYKLMGVDLNIADQHWVTLNKWNFNERNAVNNINLIPFYGYFYNQVLYRMMGDRVLLLPTSNANGTYRLWYIKKALDLETGVAATLIVQDLTYTSFDLYSDGNDISIEYTGGGTAGAEVVTITDMAISVQIQSGVSTATQVKAAIDLSAAMDLITVSISGTASTAQVTSSATNLTGGVVQVDCDGVNGWEEYIVVDAAMKCLQKEESDVSVLMAEKSALKQRIEAMASNRDAGKPERITDVNAQNFPWGYGRGI